MQEEYENLPQHASVESIIQVVQSNIQQHDSLDAKRVFHGRGHAYPGAHFITIDWYAPVLLITLFEAPQKAWEETLCDALRSIDGWETLECILIQRRYIKKAPSEVMWGTLPEHNQATEDGLQYHLMLGGQQNIGFFLDMKNGRKWIRERAEGKRILNLFSYTCAFSVVAVHAGADLVANIDMNHTALRVGYKNHRMNDLDVRRALFWEHDIFRSWSKIRKQAPYDIIIVDPPSYQRGSFVAKKDYVRLARRLPELLSPAGEILACLNAPNLDFAYLRSIYETECPSLEEVAVLPTPEEFPDSDPNKGLKTIHYRVRQEKSETLKSN